MIRSLTLAVLAAVAAVAAPSTATAAAAAPGSALAAAAPSTALAAVAPGRVVFSAATEVPVHNVDAAGALEAVALPDGGAALLVSDFKHVVAARVRADGTPDASFGAGGIARIDVPGGAFNPAQILRQPDGKLLAIGGGSGLGIRRFIVARLTASGAPDPSFGSGGFATLDLRLACANCAPAAIAPDGSIVLTGLTGDVDTPPLPNQPSMLRWTVQRLTPSGAVDAAFGSVFVAGTAGYGTVVRPSGQIIVLGSDGPTTKLQGLTAAGAPDPSFHGGQPVPPPANVFAIRLRPDGGLDAFDTLDNSGLLMRFTPAGALDPSFGAGGVVSAASTYGPRPAVLPAADGGTTLFLPAAYDATPPQFTRMRVQRVTAGGAIAETRDVTPAFGGGVVSRGGGGGGGAQNSFRATAVARPDGSLLLVGGVTVVRYTGEGAGFSTALVAVAGLTPQLTPDPSVGGPQARTRASVLIPTQRVRTALRLNRVVARVTTSGAGLVQVRVRDGRGRILAESAEPSYAAGTATARVTLTKRGRGILRQASRLRVRVGYDFRDVLTGRDGGAITARLG